jgi:hypothetical protein
MERDGEPDGEARENDVKRHREGELETREQDGIGVRRSLRQAQGENRTVVGRMIAPCGRQGQRRSLHRFRDTQPIAGGQIADARRLQLGWRPLRRYGCAAAGRILPTPLFAGRLAERSIGWGT